jgi:hypothetical protein
LDIAPKLLHSHPEEASMRFTPLIAGAIVKHHQPKLANK